MLNLPQYPRIHIRRNSVSLDNLLHIYSLIQNPLLPLLAH
ncbi:hypothetical protein NT04LM_3835 [Listeria monocytogenes FSL F2-208]|nr:hypothetical protein NT04LM_3835 [Listeria monocytogenes FSL F2-208]